MAYPILYKANETNFEHLGVSVLSDASKCYVTRERNGIYILEFNYPVNGKDVEKIKEGMIIRVDSGYRTKNQRFIVSKITKTQNEFKLYCQHISQVKTTMNAIRPDITLTSVSAMGALTAWRDNLLDSREEFFVQSDISTLNSTMWKVENIENARDALGGKAGSILDVWGGEYEFDNLNITLHRSMGIDNPTIIAYGKNLLDLEQEQSILETYTSVFPFKKYTDDKNREQLITLPEILLDSTHLNKFTHRRILKVDFSNDENIKTVEQLRSKAKSYIKSNNVGVPKTNLKINYQDLSKVEGVFDNPALEQIDLCDRLKVYYNELGILNENAKVVKVIWDVILEENHEIEVGDGRSSFTDSTSTKIESLQAQNDSVLARINALIAEQDAAFDRFFKEKSKVIEDKVKGGYEKALLSSEEKIRKMGEAFDEKVNQFREQVSATVENYNRQFQATNLEISKNRVEATKQIQTLTDRVSNIQDISNNETVRELRGLVNGATSKVTELETSITREFTVVKKKNEDGLSAVKAEFKKGVDGLTSKVSSLEEYKNQDGTRTESLKQWVQRDTASQLSRERTEINKIIDNKGFVKNTEFSNKFNESARGITNQLSALETYKNQDGVRVANMQIWAQNNTANQLTAARRSIESWVNEKGYATTSVVENKVQETANSISREIRNIRESIPTSVGGRNYITDSDKLTNINSGGTNWEKTVENGTLVFTKVRATESTGIWTQIMPFLKDNFQNEVLTWSVDVKASKNISFNNVGQETNGFKGRVDITTQWQRISHTFTNRYTQHYAFVFYQMLGTCSPGDKVYVRLPKLEIGNVATDWTPAPEDVEQNVNELNTWKQTATETLNTVSSGLNDTVKHSQLRIGADGIDFGSNKVFNGRNLTSMLSVSPESIQAITDRLIITPANENLVDVYFRESAVSSGRDLWITPEITSDKLNNGDQFIIEGIGTWSGTLRHDLNFIIAVKYKSGNWTWITSRLKARGEYSNSVIPLKTTLTINWLNEEVAMYRLGLQQPDWSNFTNITFKNAKIYKKKSAELIVDGSIEGRQIKTNTLETGHHKAGSITSEIIAAKAVKVNNLLVDDAMIQAFVAHKAFINKLWAQDAFIKSLQTVKIKSTQIDADLLSAYTGRIGSFSIGSHWAGGGRWITGVNQYQIGMSDGTNGSEGTALWVNWGNKWGEVGDNAWYVMNNGKMVCKNYATFSKQISAPGGMDINNANIKGYATTGRVGVTYPIWWSEIDNVRSQVSDKRLKTNIKPTNIKALETLNNIEIVEFNWIKDGKFEKIGAIAQQVQLVDKDLVVKDAIDKNTPSDYLRINYYDTIPYLIKAVQELSQQNKELKNKLEEITNG